MFTNCSLGKSTSQLKTSLKEFHGWFYSSVSTWGVIYIEIYHVPLRALKLYPSKYQNLKKIRTHPNTKCEENWQIVTDTTLYKYKKKNN